VWKVDGVLYTKSTGTSDKREAEKKLAEFVAPYHLKGEAGKDAKAAKLAGVAGLDATAKALADAAKAKRAEAGRLSVPLAKAWEVFASSVLRKPVAPATAAMYEGRWDKFLGWMEENAPGVKSVSEVDEDTARAFIRDVKKRSSPKTTNDYRALLAMVWGVLDKEGAGLDGFNPWQGIAKLDKETHVRRELTVEELARVVAPLTGEMRVLFAIGIYTGLRLGDAVMLDWGAVDLVRGFIQWTPHKTKKHGTVVRIPMFPALAAIFARTPARRRNGPVLPGLAEEYRTRRTHFMETVRRVFVDAEIETRKTRDNGRVAVDVGFHSLRHSFVSLCANHGVPLSIVQAIVGHTNAAMTTHYFHVSDDALRGAVAALPDVFGGKTAAALPAPTGTGAGSVGDAPSREAEAFETVPAEVARIARMLVGAPAAQLARAEKMIAKLLGKGGDK
jgi:integrase